MTIKLSELEQIIVEEAKVLPDQAPLEYFVHHNNLHHFENQNFEEAVEEIFYQYGKTAYMPLSYFRLKAKQFEIKKTFFENALKNNGYAINNLNLIEFIYENLHSFSDPKHLAFLKNEGKIYDKTKSCIIDMSEKDIDLWNEINDFKVEDNFKSFPDYHVNRSLERVNKILIPFLSSLLDQGQAGISIDDFSRKNPIKSFRKYVAYLFKSNELDKWDKIESSKDYNSEIINRYLTGKNFEEAKLLIRRHLHSIPGWAGMIFKLAHNTEVTPRKKIELNLSQYLLMRLFLEEHLIKNIEIEYIPLSSEIQIKENIFYFKKYYSNDLDIKYLYDLFCKLDQVELRRIFQQSYEQTYYSTVLNGLLLHKKSTERKPKYQMFFCIDDREESFRRYLEEESRLVETFGVAGFFGLDMMFQKVNEQYARRFCPPAAKPAYYIKEEGESLRFDFATIFHDTHNGFFKSLFYNFLIAPLKSIESNWHLYFPREKRVLSNLLRRSKVSQIKFERVEKKNNSELNCGYTIEEAALRVNNILKGAGLVNEFAQFILMIGHGHDSYNNPHVAAYRCGACSGANASPNAKIFAEMANDLRVREILKLNFNLVIPDSTYFIGGYHDTCNDQIDLFNIDNNRLKEKEYQKLLSIINNAREKNAKERCQKFYQIDNHLSPKSALKKVEKRAWHVAEPRPELNHATNSLCIVGRRSLTESVFLDRKSFLVSYDPHVDKDGNILLGLLSAVIPVCSGINLEYYFSKVDTENYGSGSKTSHNVTGFVGVMNGVRGDLRTGLVWQMVEYHDPLRILFIIESTPETIESIMQKNNEVKNLIQNRWIALALIDPNDSSKILMYQENSFVAFDSDNTFEVNTYKVSNDVPTGLTHPVHIAFIEETR